MNTATPHPMCLGPIPTHLAKIPEYASHQAWLRDEGKFHHDPSEARADRARFVGASFDGASFDGACYTAPRTPTARIRQTFSPRMTLPWRASRRAPHVNWR